MGKTLNTFFEFEDISYSKPFDELRKDAGRIAVDVNHIVRVNGSAAFPMSLPKKTGITKVLDKIFKK